MPRHLICLCGARRPKDMRIKNPWALKAAELGIPAPINRDKCTSPAPEFDCWAGTLEPFSCDVVTRVSRREEDGQDQDREKFGAVYVLLSLRRPLPMYQ